MAAKSESLDHWRGYFRAASCSVFDIIDRAIDVAVSDYPQEFRLRRDGIAERLFSCRMARCLGCDRVELAVPAEEAAVNGNGCGRMNPMTGSIFACKSGSKESKVNSSSRDQEDHEPQGELFVSNYSYGEAEALTDEIEEESKVLEEVMRIKEILFNGPEEPESSLYESLRRLQLMTLTVGTLKETGIGKVVNLLRKHGSKDISRLAQTLISGWKTLVDDYYKATPVIAAPESTPDSVKNPSTIEDEEEGLPSPPMDEAFLATQQTGQIEVFQEKFFDGMDDDGNPQTGGIFIKNRDNGVRRSLEKQNGRLTGSYMKEEGALHIKKVESVMKTVMPVKSNPKPVRQVELISELKVYKELNLQPKKPNAAPIQKRQLANQQNEMRPSDESAVQMKLEATKRKLQESYQQVEKAKKQRTVQVMDFHDLPKQKAAPKNFFPKPGMQNRHWANGRR
ncbi:hypothetical protein SAY87_010005 [Trapa incisa]|uniref:TFIIS N-terminal domain-containing protein n=1 Tax=Trapa incisa TaxID=236973 RepID=A0AAN7JI22_9MYRT|nr:hypothetical protein SAY87_010005 [Trapa incisa]